MEHVKTVQQQYPADIENIMFHPDIINSIKSELKKECTAKHSSKSQVKKDGLENIQKRLKNNASI